MAIPVTDRITRGQSGISPFAVAWQEDLKIAYVTVADLTARDAIPEWKRLPYMTAYVISEGAEFTLGSNVTIAGQIWTEKTFGIPDEVVTETELFDVNGYIKPQLIQNIFLNSSYVVASEAAMLAATSYTGNMFIRTDTAEVYIKLNNDNPADLGDFAIGTAGGAVLSVNGQIGVVDITIASLLAVPANLTDFDDAVSNSPTVLGHSSSISVIEGDLSSISSDLLALTGYVDTNLGTKLLSATAQAPGIAQDGYVIKWDNTLNRYVLAADSVLGDGTFLGLLDTPSTYVGQSGKFLRVNVAENALEFVTGGGGGGWALNGTTTLTGSVIIDADGNTLNFINSNINVGNDDASTVNIGNIDGAAYSYASFYGVTKNIEIATGDLFGDFTLINMLEASITVTSGASTFGGVTYSNDFSANYTDRSLIDKGYADATYAPFSDSDNYWKTSNDTSLLTSVSIYGNSGTYGLTISDVESFYVSTLNDFGFLELQAHSSSTPTNYGRVVIYNDQVALSADYLDGTTNTAFVINETNAELGSTTIGFQGLKYVHDYSASYTDRSLVDKGYADNTYIAITNPNIAYINVANIFSETQEISRTGAVPVLNLNRPEILADNTGLGSIYFNGFSSTSVPRTYAGIEAVMIDDTNTTEDGALTFVLYKNGGFVDYIYLNNGNLGDIRLLQPVRLSSVANDDALTQVLVRDNSTGEIKYRTAASLGGGGIGGSITDNQVAIGATTANTIEGSANLTYDGTTFTVNGGTIVGSATTQNIFNSTATTVNIGSAATTARLGASTGTLTLGNATVVGLAATQVLYNTVATNMSFAGAATTLTIGATTGTMTLRNPTVVGQGTTATLWNTTNTTVNFAGAATTFTVGGTPTTALTANFFANATATATTKTLNIGTAGAAGSTTNVNIGSATASAILGTLSLNFPTVLTAVNNTTVNLWNTLSTTVNFAGEATSLTIGANTGTMNLRNATIVLTQAPANDASFSTSQLLVRDSSGNLDVIAASGGGTTNFLRADGTWTTLIAGHVIKNAGTPLTQRANLNVSNGLTASDNTPDTDIKLGGLLTANTNITLNSFNLINTTTSGDNIFYSNGDVVFGNSNLISPHLYFSRSKSAFSIGSNLGGSYAFNTWDFVQGSSVNNFGTGTSNLIKGQGIALNGVSSGNIINAEGVSGSANNFSNVSYNLILQSTNSYHRDVGGSIFIGDNNIFNASGTGLLGIPAKYNLQIGNWNNASDSNHLFQWGTGLKNNYGLATWSNWTYQPKFYFGNANVEYTLAANKASFVIANGFISNGSRSDPGTYFSHSFSHMASGWTQINTTNATGFEGGGVSLVEADVTPAAPLDIVSTTGGLLIPRMTTTQKNAIVAAPNGSQVYDSTLNQFQFRQGGSWLGLRSYTFSNGLTESSGTVKLGGALIEDTTISGNFNKFFTGTNSFVIGHTAVTGSARLQVRGIGTTTGNLVLLEDSAGTERLKVLDNGTLTATALSSTGDNFTFIGDTNTDDASREIVKIAKRWSGGGAPTGNNEGRLGFYISNSALADVNALRLSWNISPNTAGAEFSNIRWYSLQNGANTLFFQAYDSVTSLGVGATVVGAGDTAIGFEAKGANGGITALGYRAGNTSGTVGASAISLGYNANQGTHNIGADSIAIGRLTKTSASQSIAIGTNYTNSVADSFALGWGSLDILFAKAADSYFNTTANIGFFTGSGVAYNSMTKGFFMGDASAAPSGNPTAGAYFWVDPTTHLPKWRVPGGTVYTLSDTSGGGLSDADYGDITVSGGGTVMTVDVDIAKTWTSIHSFQNNKFRLYNPANTFYYEITTTALAANRSITLPLLTGGDTFVFEGFAATLTNKTLGTGTVFSVIPTINDGITFTFNPSATVAGLNVGALSGDPSGLVNGDIWYDSGTNKLRARQNGSSVDMIGGGGGWATTGATSITGNVNVSGAFDIAIYNTNTRIKLFEATSVLELTSTNSEVEVSPDFIGLFAEQIMADGTLNNATGDQVFMNWSATINKATSGNYTGIKLNITQTSAPGADNRLLDLQVASSSVFSISSTGDIIFADGIRQTFNPNATNAGLNVGSHTANPSAPTNGDIYYDSTNNLLRARINGAWVSLGAGGGVSDGDKGDITVSGTGATWTIDLDIAKAWTGIHSFTDNDFRLFNPANTFSYNFRTSAIAADRNITLPLLTTNDVFVCEAFAQTLTNKTINLSSNTLSGTKAQFDTALSDDDFAYIGTANSWGAVNQNIAATGKWQEGGVSISPIGKHEVWIPASAMMKRVTTGSSALTQVEFATSIANLAVLDFDQTTQEYASFSAVLPRNWNNGTITYFAYWTAAAGTGTVTWSIKAGAYSNDDALTTAMGTAVAVTDTLIATGDVHIADESGALTIGGTPADNDLIIFEVSRDVADTLSADARLIGVKIVFTTDAAVTA